MEDKILLLETQVRHLKNDLHLTKEENDIAVSNYFELYSNLEGKVEERAGHIKALQKALAQKARELEVMLDSSPSMIFYKDVDQRLIRVNRKFAKTVGLSIKKIIGKRYYELFPENEDHGIKKDLDVIQKGIPIINKRESIVTPKGNKQILIDRIPYKDIDNRVIGLICFALDITELEKAETEKRELEAQLQHTQ
ncbi:MAG: PAS domain-containing protein, partial [Pseudomonadota bacterium]